MVGVAGPAPAERGLHPVLAEITIYPVKSLGGVSVQAAQVEPWGLEHDRRWLVLNPDGTVLTARRERRMLGLTAAPLEGGGIVLTASDGSSLHVDAPSSGEHVPVSLSRLDSLRLASSEASEWLSSQLSRHVRLAWLDDPRRRSVSMAHGGRPGEPLNLSDAGPLLLATTASLEQLNGWMRKDTLVENQVANPISIRRFRPNVVIGGAAPPFVEDNWQQVRIGEVEFRLGEHCDRCVMTTIDPETLMGGKQPLRTLARYRQWNHKTWFGIRLIPMDLRPIRVGDLVVARQAAVL